MGQANAVIAHGDGPSAAYFNPAQITKLPGTRIEVGTTLLIPHREYQAINGATYETQETVLVPPTTLYLTHAFTDKLSGSFAMFSPFGLSTDWGSTWPGQFLTTKATMTTLNFNPALAYRILPNLSLAAGFDLVFLSATLKSALPSSALGIPGPLFGIPQKFSGSGNGVGFNLGLMYDVTNALSLGIAYRSQVVISVGGNYYNDISPPVGAKASASVTLPQQLTAGIAYRPAKPLVVEMGVRWEDWTAMKNLTVQVPGFTAAVYPRDWHGTLAINVGGKYRFNDTFSAMLGYLYGWNPIPDSTFEPSIPDSNSHIFCVGGEARLQDFTIGLSYGYQLQQDRNKFINMYGPFAMGSYSSYFHLVGLSIGYQF
jgi:long-chain fatty acid transport protein